MRIIKIISVMFVAMFVLNSSVMSYSTDAYSIELPSTYSKSENSTENLTIFNEGTTTGMPNFNVYLGDNNENSNAKNASSSEISKLADTLCDQIYSSYGIKVDVIQKEKISFNGYDAIFLSTKWNSQSVLGYTAYQNQYIMTSKNHVYTITFTADDAEELESTEFATVKNSFVINDDLKVNSWFDVDELLIFTIIGAIVGVIFGFIKSKLKVN